MANTWERSTNHNRWSLRVGWIPLALLASLSLSWSEVRADAISAKVVALDQHFFWNRIGACHPQGQMFALARDVFPEGTAPGDETLENSCAMKDCSGDAGHVQLRSTKRPRPLVLRMNEGDTMTVEFTNLLHPADGNLDGFLNGVPCPKCRKWVGGIEVNATRDEQVRTRHASIHVIGMSPMGSIASDGSNVGTNASSLAAPGEAKTYSFYAAQEGICLMYSTGATTTGEGDGGQIPAGLFGVVNVEPKGSTWYRSQVTAQDMILAADANGNGVLDGGEKTAQGHPIVDYNAVYPAGHLRAGETILKMRQGNEVVHSDLTAVIAGPFTDPYPPNPTYPDRNQPFREFTIIYHDELGAVQAFPQFSDPVLSHTLHGVQDAFAFNYGTGGIGAEIIANRLGVGAAADCVGCKYEEFFLTSWALGDPAMVVDVPANAGVLTDENGNITVDPNAPRATEAFYPDDPSNVYHSYLRDHAKMRIVHAGPKEHHIHHLHAHQWLYAADSDESAYLDSQALGPGAGFTLDMVYNGSGNRNQTAGDSIFHCHFYPHFAMGMWALWRVHDVFEDGSRKLPDPEIAQGAPIPGVVPMPGLAMAPMPTLAVTIAPDPRFDPDGAGPLPNKRGGQVKIDLDGNGTGDKFAYELAAADVAALSGKHAGYPFFIPGVSGSRPPHPPLDTIHDGGLPRHVLGQGHAVHVETRLDFTKEIEEAEAFAIPETGNPVELAAMEFHESRYHPSFKPDGTAASFITNGAPRVAGAPFAEPCIDDSGTPVGRGALGASGDAARLYKAAVIQLDVVFNKSGWHFPQQRIITLWDDVQDTYDAVRPPEPFFFRANSGECIEFWHTNLVPNIYELDDFQVRTPTDILGQHIHLVKFDVLASDGSANGFNYEDATFSPDEVIERINAINAHYGAEGYDHDGDPATQKVTLAAVDHPKFGVPGAQTTVQRWWADPVVNLNGEDRTLRTVFTHDHYGPSTHQQAGLYAGLVVEPKDSTWYHNETGDLLADGRDDGGPTSWQAVIDTTDSPDLGAEGSYREFMFEMQDFALAYYPDSHPGIEPGKGPTFPNEWAGPPLGQQPGHGAGADQPGKGLDNRAKSVNPPAKKEVPLDDPGGATLLAKANECPGGVLPPCPEAISADDPGTYSINYRNEPVALRVRNPSTNTQANGLSGDLSHVFRSDITRADPDLNGLGFQPLTGGLSPNDPYTPLMRAFEGDRVQVRTLMGAHEEGHNTSFHGIKWLWEPSWGDSGWRNSMMHGISEHFEFVLPVSDVKGDLGFEDYRYSMGSAVDDLWNGNWGILRTYSGSGGPDDPLMPLPSNPDGKTPPRKGKEFRGVCPRSAPSVKFKVHAYLAQDVLPAGTLDYNVRAGLHDPTAILFVRDGDVDKRTGKLKAGVPVEPLILRANAGDCIDLTLVNQLPANMDPPDIAGFNAMPMIVEEFNTNQVKPSADIGLHTQLLAYDMERGDGANVGFNPVQTAPPGGDLAATIKYTWYAGDLSFDEGTGDWTSRPIEFGAVNLISSDPIKHSNKGAVGALIIEPKGATWVEDADRNDCGGDPMTTPRCSRASATVTPGGGNGDAEFEEFREFVLVYQDDINLRCDGCGDALLGDVDAVPNLAQSEDPEDTAQKALNYRTEPMWTRDTDGFLWPPNATLEFTRTQDIHGILTNAKVGGTDPETPLFLADKGQKVRFRVLEPGGHARNHVPQVHGHLWYDEGFTNGSDELGANPASWWYGSQMGHGPTSHMNLLSVWGAGGYGGVTGDFLYRDQPSFHFDGGLWGIFRVK